MSVSRGKSAGNGVGMKREGIRGDGRWLWGYAREEDGKGIARGSGEDGEVEREHGNGEEAIGLGGGAGGGFVAAQRTWAAAAAAALER